MLKGILYTAFSKYSGVLITIIITAILSRLLSPEEFGIVALVTVFIGFFNLLGYLGIGPAIIQVKELNSGDINSIFAFTIVTALFLSLTFFLSAGPISGFYEEPELIPVVQLLSLSVFFSILLIVPQALALKKLQFKKIAFVTVCVQFFSGISAISLAYMGSSYYAIVIQHVLSSLLLFCFFYFYNPLRISLSINWKSISKITSFSSYQFGFTFVNYFSRNLDNILIGKYLGSMPLGYYNKSYSLMQLPVSNLTHVITPVLHPVLAKHEDNKEYIYESYIIIVKLLAVVGFPLSVFLYFSSSELIFLFFGSQWDKSVPVFELLAITIGFQICLSSTGSIFQALNKAKLMFLVGVLSSLFMVTGIVYGVFIGKSLLAVGYGLIVALVINFLLGFYFLIAKGLQKSFINFLKIFILPLSSSIIATGIFSSIQIFRETQIFLQLIINIIVLLIIYLSCYSFSKDIRQIIKKFK